MKNKIKLFISGSMIAIMSVLTLLAKNCKDSFFYVYMPVSKKIVSALSDITSFVSFDIWEIIATILFAKAVFLFIKSIKNKNILTWFCDILFTTVTIVFLFVTLWGLNYYAPSMSSRLELDDVLYTPSELAEATQYYCDLASIYAENVQREDTGLIQTDFYEMSFQAGECYRELSKEYPIFDGSYARVKKLITGRIFTMRGTTGIFICLTGESNVSEYVFSRSLPFTMCHEIGHRMAFARENEANFAAFLRCLESNQNTFIYSGYYHAFINCYNALYKVDREKAIEIINSRSDCLVFDLWASNKHYEKIEIEKAVEVSDKIYEQYLQSFDVDNGIQSYGEVVDLLSKWYFQRIKK